MAKFSNQLTDAELERLAILSEEMGEAQQVIGKIIRHGYESFDPARSEEMFIETKGTNRCDLEKELGDVLTAVEFMVTAKDVREMAIRDRGLEKRQKIKKYLHHQLAPAPSPGVTSEPARDYDFHGNPPNLPVRPGLDKDEGGSEPECLDCDCGVDPKHECFLPPWAHAQDCPYRTQKPRDDSSSASGREKGDL